MFWGKITYSIEKNPILGDLTALYIQWLTYKCYFSRILLNILIIRLLKNKSSVVATLATVGNLFIGKIPKWPPNDVIHFGCFYVFP